MAHWDKEDVFQAQLDDHPNTCCVLPKIYPSLRKYLLFFDDTISWHSWQCLSSPERLTHGTWQVRTQNIFPLISIIRIFSVCPSFPFFWLGVPRTNGCITRPPLHDIRKQPRRKLMNVFVWSWHGSHPGIISPPDIGPPGQVTGGGDQASCVSRCLVTLWFIFRCNKVRCPQGTDTHGQQGAINYASITILTSMTTL